MTHTGDTAAAWLTSCFGRRCAAKFALWRWHKFHWQCCRYWMLLSCLANKMQSLNTIGKCKQKRPHHPHTQTVHYNGTTAVQHVTTCCQSPYLHKPAIVIVTLFSLWHHSILIVTSFATELALPTVTDVHYGHLTMIYTAIQKKLEMWANAQPDGRPAEYRWRPLLNAAVWLTPTTRVPCTNAANTRNPLKFARVPQTSARISAVSWPKFTILWGHVEEILLLNKFFFRLSVHALVAKI